MEAKRLEGTIARIADLEVRVKAALKAGNEGIAREGAEAIAALEADRDAAEKARTLFDTRRVGPGNFTPSPSQIRT